MNTPDAMRALAGGTATGVSAPMKDRGTVTVTHRHGESCPFTVTNELGEMKRTYKFRKIATAFRRARENTSVNVEWSTAA
jgi:hypothetical protein